MMNSVRRRMVSLGAFALAFAVTLGAVEVFLRGAEVSLPTIVLYDEKAGMLLRPDRRLNGFAEGFYMGGTNAYGYFGPGYPEERAPGAVRVALIGDSYVEGHQMFVRHYFGTVMAEELEALAGISIEALNFGRSGFDLSDSYCYRENFVSQFAPDITLVFIGPGDLSTPSAKPTLPHAYLEGDSLRISYAFAEGRDFLFRQQTQAVRGASGIMMLVGRVRENIAQGLAFEIFLEKLYAARPAPARSAAARSPEISPVAAAILRELTTDPSLYIVLSEVFAREVAAELTATYPRVIDLADCLASVENARYWRATNQRGHWNHAACAEIGRFLAERLVGTVAASTRTREPDEIRHLR